MPEWHRLWLWPEVSQLGWWFYVIPGNEEGVPSSWGGGGTAWLRPWESQRDLTCRMRAHHQEEHTELTPQYPEASKANMYLSSPHCRKLFPNQAMLCIFLLSSRWSMFYFRERDVQCKNIMEFHTTNNWGWWNSRAKSPRMRYISQPQRIWVQRKKGQTILAFPP